jgi:hypothetical protein
LVNVTHGRCYAILSGDHDFAYFTRDYPNGIPSLGHVFQKVFGPMRDPDLESIIARELAYFPTESIKGAFLGLMAKPRAVNQGWIYGKESHKCWIVATDSREQIVFCQTGFGPDFPWSCQNLGESRLGMDSQWCAYLYEAFAPSKMWNGPIPDDFMLMGPGERHV